MTGCKKRHRGRDVTLSHPIEHVYHHRTVRVHSQKLNSQLANTPISPSSCHSLILPLGQFHFCGRENLHVVGAISVVLETVVLMTVKEEYDRGILSIIKAGVVAMEFKMG